MRSDLPAGTVTFLFTDVEGSTRLLHELGADAYAAALAEHRRVIREACAAGGGVEVDTQGDAFFFAFPTAPGALDAATAFTEELSASRIHVRVGLHTGTPLLADEGYVGDDVHFAARVASAGHGGQVVVSSAAAELVEAELTDLGEHRLKDIAEAVALFQLGKESFPPLKTISNTNLPRPASSFLGRERELSEVVSRIEAGARLVTLTGPGGTGKTRLAIEAATSLVGEYRAGVFWVGLTSLRDHSLVTETISQALGAKDSLAEHIAERELLLLLDNFEQVIDAASALAELMQVCPNLTLLVTTRELLRITGEVEYAVPPLAEPEAVALFCERGQLEPSEEIAELCACLDSLPLAVELAAARTKALSPAQILARLSQRLDLLKGGRDADPRQQTLRATIGWSYDLLSPHEQELFARCSVFAGGCTLEAAEEVCDADLDTLQSLVEKSLLRFSNERYWMLETIREYASTAFGEEEALAVYPRHARFYKALAERAGERMAERLRGDILIELENELPNLRGALAWFRSSDSHADELQLHRALKKFWLARDHVAEGENLLKEALVRIPDDASDDRMRVELALGEIMMRRGRPEEARPSVERWLRWARSGGNVSEAAWALSSLASLSMRDGDFTTSLPLLDDALGLARETGDVAQISHVLGNLGYTLTGLGDYERAVDMCRESIGMAPTAPDSAIDHANLGLALLGLGDVDGAGDAYRVATAYALESGHFFALADALVGVAAVLAARGDSRSALVVLAAVDKLRTDLGLPAEPLELDLDSRTAATARALLGHEAVQAWDAGRALTVDEAVEYALASID